VFRHNAPFLNIFGKDTPLETLTYDIPPTVDEIVARQAARALDERALRTIFLEARTANGFVERPVPRDLLARAVEIALMGPTSANSLPARIVFVETPEAKERLRPALSPGNVEKTMAAPVTAIIATDLHFHDHFPRTFPERGEMLKGMFAAMEPAAQRASAWDNAVLQMGYFIIAPWAGSTVRRSTQRFSPTVTWSRSISSTSATRTMRSSSRGYRASTSTRSRASFN
jgi:hypothetical protein